MNNDAQFLGLSYFIESFLKGEIEEDVFNATIENYKENQWKVSLKVYEEVIRKIKDLLDNETYDKIRIVQVKSVIDDVIDKILIVNDDNTNLSIPITGDIPFINIAEVKKACEPLQKLRNLYNAGGKGTDYQWHKYEETTASGLAGAMIMEVDNRRLWTDCSLDNNKFMLPPILCMLIKGSLANVISDDIESSILCNKLLLFKKVYYDFTFYEIVLDSLNDRVAFLCANTLDKCRNKYKINCLLYYTINVLVYNIVCEGLKNYLNFAKCLLDKYLTKVNLNDLAYIYFIRESLPGDHLNTFSEITKIACQKNNTLCSFPYLDSNKFSGKKTYQGILERLMYYTQKGQVICNP